MKRYLSFLLLVLQPLISKEDTPSLQQQEHPQFFNHPGIVTQRGQSWVGSEHLYNLQKELLVTVEMVKPEDSLPALLAEDVQAQVIKALNEQGIKASTEYDGAIPLPFLNVLVLVSSREKDVSAYISLRLFEAVRIQRVILDPPIIFQAITWQKQVLVSAKEWQIKDEVQNILTEMAQQFIKLIKSY